MCQGNSSVDWFDLYLSKKAQLDFLSARCMAMYREGYAATYYEGLSVKQVMETSKQCDSITPKKISTACYKNDRSPFENFHFCSYSLRT